MEEENKRIIEFFVKIDKELLFVNNFWNTQRARSLMNDIYQMMGVEY